MRCPGVALDAVEGVGHHAQRPQAEQVDLHEAELLDVLLVVLGHDPAGHGGALDRDEVDERRPGDEHAADVDAEVAREAVDLGAQLEEPLPPVAGRWSACGAFVVPPDYQMRDPDRCSNARFAVSEPSRHRTLPR